MGMVHAAQEGDLKNPSSEVKKVAKDIDPEDAGDFAATKHKGLPEKKTGGKKNEHNKPIWGKQGEWVMYKQHGKKEHTMWETFKESKEAVNESCSCKCKSCVDGDCSKCSCEDCDCDGCSC